MNGATVKTVVLKSFEEKGLCKISTFTVRVTPFTFFVDNYHIFLLIFDGNIFLFACLRQIHKVLLRFEQYLGLNYL